jgi:hypothetical protein
MPMVVVSQEALALGVHDGQVEAPAIMVQMQGGGVQIVCAPPGASDPLMAALMPPLLSCGQGQHQPDQAQAVGRFSDRETPEPEMMPPSDLINMQRRTLQDRRSKIEAMMGEFEVNATDPAATLRITGAEYVVLKDLSRELSAGYCVNIEERIKSSNLARLLNISPTGSVSPGQVVAAAKRKAPPPPPPGPCTIGRGASLSGPLIEEIHEAFEQVQRAYQGPPIRQEQFQGEVSSPHHSDGAGSAGWSHVAPVSQPVAFAPPPHKA